MTPAAPFALPLAGASDAGVDLVRLALRTGAHERPPEVEVRGAAAAGTMAPKAPAFAMTLPRGGCAAVDCAGGGCVAAAPAPPPHLAMTLPRPGCAAVVAAGVGCAGAAPPPFHRAATLPRDGTAAGGSAGAGLDHRRAAVAVLPALLAPLTVVAPATVAEGRGSLAAAETVAAAAATGGTEAGGAEAEAGVLPAGRAEAMSSAVL